MGKASRWFRGLLGLKQPNPNPNSPSKPPKEKRRWSFVKSYREKSSTSNPKQPPSHPPPSYPNYEAPTPTSSSSYVDGGDDANKHAIAVAAATAAVAEAAVAAAQAAAAVVRLTNSGRCETSSTTITNDENNSNCSISNNNNGVVTQNRGEKDLLSASSAAVVIQSHFRGYLARRALRALKGLVKLQALVRGHIMRRKTSETMRCMQAMVRAQARARLVRSHIPESPFSSTKSCPIILHPGPPTPEKFEQFCHAEIMKHDHLTKTKRNSSRSSSRINTMSQQDMSNFGSSWSDPRNTRWDARDTSSTTRTCLTDDDRADRILEIDTGKPHYTTLRRRSLFEGDQVSHSHTTSKDSMTHHTTSSPVSCEVVQTLKNLALPQEMIDDSNSYCTAENSPQYCSAASQGDTSSRRGGPFTPTKSDGSRSFLSGYSDCPSYMSYTESSKAKMRSVSAPKQRPQYERTSSNKRYSIHGFGEHHPRSNAQRSAAMHASFTSKAYPGSGRLDRLGMPVKDNTVVYYSGYLN